MIWQIIGGFVAAGCIGFLCLAFYACCCAAAQAYSDNGESEERP